jgi:hypothetical protein
MCSAFPVAPMLLPLGSGFTLRTFCVLGFDLVIPTVLPDIVVSSFICWGVYGWPVSALWLRLVMRVLLLFFSPSCYLLRRRAIRLMFSANTARFFASPPFRFAAAIFFVVAFPKAPTVPLRVIFLVAF